MHSGSGFNVSHFEMSGTHGGIGVKELEYAVLEFGEFFGVLISLVIFEIII